MMVSMMVVVAVSYLLSATVQEVLGPGRRVAFWVLRCASLGLYATLASSGHAGAGSILLAESVTMFLILALHAHPSADAHRSAEVPAVGRPALG